jgi:hypothetical protein
LAYASVYGDTLYAGAFHREGSKYITPESHHVTTPAGDKNTALMMVYTMNPDTGKPMTELPTMCYSTISNVQGMCLTDSGNIVLSTSWGLSKSHLYQYDVSSATQSQFTTVNINGSTIPTYCLDSATLVKTVVTPPMAEELVCLDGRVYVLTESASMKYIFGKFMSGNYVYSYPMA